MKRIILFTAITGSIFTLGTACNNNKAADANADTVVVEKNTTTTIEKSVPEPSTSISVGSNGASVTTKSTDIKVSKDSVTYKKH